MAGPWNANITSALKFTEFTPATTTVPTTTEATLMWQGASAEMEGEFLAAGITISSSGKDKTAAALVEAKIASATVQESFEKQTQGRVSPDTERLKKEYRETMDRWLRKPYILSQLGASVHGIEVRSVATEYENTDRDTSEYESPLLTEYGRTVDRSL